MGLLALFWQFSLVFALNLNGPRSTDKASVITANYNPRPTEVAKLIKRDPWPASYCGFIGGIEGT
jgi:hypothetical protein